MNIKVVDLIREALVGGRNGEMEKWLTFITIHLYLNYTTNGRI